MKYDLGSNNKEFYVSSIKSNASRAEVEAGLHAAATRARKQRGVTSGYHCFRAYSGAAVVFFPPFDGTGATGSQKVRGDRRAIEGFTFRSQSSFQTLLAKIERGTLPWFVTLTYPLQFPTEPTVWKDDLDRMTKWLRRSYPMASGVWKLEPQERGAPHFHLLLWSVTALCPVAMRLAWWKITNTGCEVHKEKGVDVRRAFSDRAVMAYASKAYMGKEVVLPDWWRGVGRLWGVINRAFLPLAPETETVLRTPDHYRLRRIARKYLRRKLGREMHGCTQRLFTSCPEQWEMLARRIGETWPVREDGSHSGPLPIATRKANLIAKLRQRERADGFFQPKDY